MPLRSASTARAIEEKGVWLAGRMMPVQPAAHPGPALRVTIAEGKFQGVIAAKTDHGAGRWICRVEHFVRRRGDLMPINEKAVLSAREESLRGSTKL
jgi:hypothetical protein